MSTAMGVDEHNGPGRIGQMHMRQCSVQVSKWDGTAGDGSIGLVQGTSVGLCPMRMCLEHSMRWYGATLQDRYELCTEWISEGTCILMMYDPHMWVQLIDRRRKLVRSRSSPARVVQT